ncbi:MAG TPA: T9SS type A sorting domain-containing protein [Flavobacteriia bacterium]|nr:T9SS type A sorting domain-containing protein [Flavobacteriia bacterium]
MKFKKILLIFFVFSMTLYSQEKNASIWMVSSKHEAAVHPLKHRSSTPQEFKIYTLNLDLLKSRLANAPERELSHGDSNVIVSFPMVNGKLENFKVFKSSIMEDELQAQHPEIQTYAAQGIDDPTATMRFSITNFGLHAMTLSGKHVANYIDPYTENQQFYIIYGRDSVLNDPLNDFICETDSGYEVNSSNTSNLSTNRNDTNDQTLRTYRLALSCNAEYGNLFAGSGTDAQKKANILAQMVSTMNRVNEVYERDLAIHLNIIANNTAIIYYGDTSADPWSGEYNNTTQTVIDNIIGNANYDIGHNFNTSGGGNAGCIGCVCQTGSKGSGYTGRADPTGDAFDIDYVAHEMGHQFGGYHTMNTCSRSGSGQTEVEPASGSSIMGYAGICTANVQGNSDAHFNYVNIRDISSNIQTGVSTCAAQTGLSNVPPVANAGSNYTIPKSTAYVLEGSATDVDGMASLTYNWSQNDPEQSPSGDYPASTNTVGPMYRSIFPTSSPKRYLPKFSDVLSGNLTPTWEVTPSVSRFMEFAFTVRDNDVNGGQTDADLMTVNVNANAGPFAVTSQMVNEIWNTGETKTITWDVAGTTGNSINASNVNIYLVDDAANILATLASNIANDGNETVSVPNITTDFARVMVKPTNNIFYAINAATIGVNSNPQTCTGVCPSEGNTAYATSTTLVNFNTINNATAKENGAYSDFTNLSTTVDISSNYDLTVNVNTDGNYMVVTKAWIDWNQDCDFDDPGEEYDLGSAANVTSGATSNSPLTITVPSGAATGQTVLRVSSKYTSSTTVTYPASCDTGFDGEVEDYSVIVNDPTNTIYDNLLNESLNAYQNNTILQIETANGSNIKNVSIYDVLGKVLLTNQNINSSEASLDISAIKSGTLVFINTEIENGSIKTNKLIIR